MNGMLNNKIRTRADRILTNNISINKTTMIGAEAIETTDDIKTDKNENTISDGKAIYPSDHFWNND